MKTRKFYEFILIDIDSIKITHNTDKNNLQRIAFSKCQILRVMTLTDWNKKNPLLARLLVNISIPWAITTKTTWMSGITCSICKVISIYSLFNFQEAATPQFPAWFQKWWTFFGLLDSIFPLEIQEKFNFCKSKTLSWSITQLRLLIFCSRIRIPWIFIWNIIKKQEQLPHFLLSLSTINLLLLYLWVFS